MDNKQIEQWILDGLTDDEIQVKLDEIENAKHAPSADYLASKDESDDDAPSPAPGPDVDTLQNTIDRVVNTIDIIGNKKVSGGDIASTTEVIATEDYIDSIIQVYDGQHFDFIKEQTGTKFEDSTLFHKVIYSSGYTKTGGTNWDDNSTGATMAHAHRNGYVNDPGDRSVFDSASYAVSGSNKPHANWSVPSGSTTYYRGSTESNGAGANYAAGVRMLHVTYVALKNITVGEMK